MKGSIVIAQTLAAALVFACSSTKNSDKEGEHASMTFALSGGDFTGNSVRICGSRPAPDPKYRCNFSLTPDIEAGTDAGDACPCFNFNADGSLMDEAGAPAVIAGLCPSADFPTANWAFSYALFSEPNCGGTQLNDGEHNFTCYDSTDIASQNHPNQSVEDVLNPGPNTNHILCNTVNASKGFNFGSCATATTPEDAAIGTSRFNCGCIPVADTCDCGGGGVTADVLEDGCSFDPDTCEIVCNTPPIRRIVPQGSCKAGNSQSAVVNGKNVVSYIPRATWQTSTTDISIVNVEGTSVTPTRVTTASPVNSCASNAVTGQTVCTGNDATVYILRGATITNTLTSAATNIPLGFSGGECLNCYAMMDAVNNRAFIALTLGDSPINALGGFQILDLNPNTFWPPFRSLTPYAKISESALVDPIRNFILSPQEDSTKIFEIIDVSDPSTPKFFENRLTGYPQGEFDSVGEDCDTGIVLAPTEYSFPTSLVYITDLTQATFTPGSPGTWTSPSQAQWLTESVLMSSGCAVMIAQGTHQGILNGEEGGDAITALQLPSTSGPGAGIPSVTDWVTCRIPGGFVTGDDPHTTTAYMSPNTGHAIGMVVNEGATLMAVVDLTSMLDPAMVPRTSGPGRGHACVDGELPPSLVRFISIP